MLLQKHSAIFSAMCAKTKVKFHLSGFCNRLCQCVVLEFFLRPSSPCTSATDRNRDSRSCRCHPARHNDQRPACVWSGRAVCTHAHTASSRDPRWLRTAWLRRAALACSSSMEARSALGPNLASGMAANEKRPWSSTLAAAPGLGGGIIPGSDGFFGVALLCVGVATTATAAAASRVPLHDGGRSL